MDNMDTLEELQEYLDAQRIANSYSNSPSRRIRKPIKYKKPKDKTFWLRIVCLLFGLLFPPLLIIWLVLGIVKLVRDDK